MRCPRPCWGRCVRFSDLEGARIGVWGAGREIRSLADQVARRLPQASIAVAVFDGPPPQDARLELHAPAALILGAADGPGALLDCDVLVRSPGVSIHRPEIELVRAGGVPVTTATSLWLQENGGPGVIGITGTKGKSTTAALVHHLALAAGASAHLAGNIGAPALDLLDEEPAQVTVIELSSYQIADLQSGPEVVLLTNLYREHADWHGSEEAYRKEKLRILRLPGVLSLVVNGRDPALMAASEGLARRLYGVPGGWDVTGGEISRDGERVMSAADLPMAGEHNALNLCGALTALEAAAVALPALPQALSGLRPLPHRLETVRDDQEGLWVNDSISTTPQSAIAALQSFPGREVVLIAGGQDRGQDHRELARVLAENGGSVIGVPSTGPSLVAAARAAGVPPARAIEAGDLADAVDRARAIAAPGAVILLSPAAASYDHYVNFEERGERFRALAGTP